jgi:CBS domain-containing protein
LERIMQERQVRRVPVVEDGACVGIVAQADVALHGKSKEVGKTVAEISKPPRAQDALR